MTQADASPSDAGQPVSECSGCNDDYACLNPGPQHTCRGQFADWAPSYSRSSFAVNNDGTVTDKRTQLVWQRQTSSSAECSINPGGIPGCTWEEAKRVCANLASARMAFRLPTLIELLSILDDTRSNPAFDPTIFPIAAQQTAEDQSWLAFAWTWTASTYAGNAENVWLVDFRDGSTSITTKPEHFAVRCVRSDPASAAVGGAASARYTFPEPGIVQDAHTKLTWQQQVDPGKYTLAGAKSFCERSSLANGGWRLPSRAELVTLGDPTRANPAISADAFPATPFGANDGFWTTTPYQPNPAEMWFVWFNGGQMQHGDPATALRVRCVR